MDKATDSYNNHRKNIETINLEMDKAYEREKSRALNITTVQRWELLRRTEHNLFGGFLKAGIPKVISAPVSLRRRKHRFPALSIRSPNSKLRKIGDELASGVSCLPPKIV